MTTMTEHKELLAWVKEMAAMCQPDEVVWIDGSDEQRSTHPTVTCAVAPRCRPC